MQLKKCYFLWIHSPVWSSQSDYGQGWMSVIPDSLVLVPGSTLMLLVDIVGIRDGCI